MGPVAARAASAAAIGGAYVTSIGLARLIGRRRPCHDAAARPLIDCPDGPSLPSDQAAAAFAAATLLGWLQPSARLWLHPAAAAVAAARVVAGVHHWTDVAAGAGLGMLIGRAGRAALYSATDARAEAWAGERASTLARAGR